MSAPMEPLFEGLEGYESELDFANAPTPYMNCNFDDLNEIESDDLLDYNTDIKQYGTVDSKVDSNNNSYVMPVMSVENEVEISVNSVDTNFINELITEPTYIELNAVGTSEEPTTETLSPFPVITQTRKRTLSFINDESDEDEEEEEYQPRRKSKVGRKPSKGPNKCMSRNAIAARENREKKKAYVDELEKKNKQLAANDKQSKQLLNKYIELAKELEAENRYLKGVIANDSSISKLIKDMTKTNQIELIGTGFMVASNGNIEDLEGGKVSARKSSRIAAKVETSDTKLKGNQETGGICFHIHKKRVSLELCGKCAQKHKKGK